MIWNYPTRVIFDNGALAQLAGEAKRLGGDKVLLVVDSLLPVPLVKACAEALSAGGLTPILFDGVHPNPVESDAALGAEAFLAGGCQLIVGFGGGSALDAAKLIAVRLRTPLPFEELDDATGGSAHVPADLVPVIAVPTTAGTGSEVGRAAVVLAAATGHKTVIFHPAMMPRVALLDPQLTVGLPPAITAATGFDALTHCLEALAAQGDHPMADGIALEGLRLIGRSLLAAVQHGDNLAARGDMMKAAMMGAVAFQKGLGACHSLAHPLSSECGLHHGLANALCLPAVVEFNSAYCAEAYGRAQAALGIPPEVTLAEGLRQLRAALNLPDGLGAVGVGAELYPRLAGLAVADGCHTGNPRPCTEAELKVLYEAST